MWILPNDASRNVVFLLHRMEQGATINAKASHICRRRWYTTMDVFADIDHPAVAEYFFPGVIK